MSQLILIVIVAALAIGGAYYWYEFARPGVMDGIGNEEEVDISDWATYMNTEFGFAISHPRDWRVYEFEGDPMEPMINIYKPGSDENRLPFTHHSSGVTHVSIFPQGLATEGVFGEWEESSVDVVFPVNAAIDYVLFDGSAWATYIGVEEVPAGWSEFGFLYAQTAIQNHATDCMRAGEIVPQEQCNPLEGDRVIHYGSIDEEDRAIQEAMLATFRFRSSNVE